MIVSLLDRELDLVARTAQEAMLHRIVVASHRAIAIARALQVVHRPSALLRVSIVRRSGERAFQHMAVMHPREPIRPLQGARSARTAPPRLLALVEPLVEPIRPQCAQLEHRAGLRGEESASKRDHPLVRRLRTMLVLLMVEASAQHGVAVPPIDRVVARPTMNFLRPAVSLPTCSKTLLGSRHPRSLLRHACAR